jgi:hypothetical protein
MYALFPRQITGSPGSLSAREFGHRTLTLLPHQATRDFKIA